jgi:hypothetical protein
MTFTLPSAPPSALALVRLLLALPPHLHLRIVWVDWEAGTFRYVP